MDATKTCNKCKHTYPATTDHFHVKRDNKDGLCSTCKDCRRKQCREYQRQYYVDHRKQCLERSREWRNVHLPESIERERRFRANNRERIRNRNRQYYANHREQCLENSREWRQKNLEICAELQRKWRRDYPRERFVQSFRVHLDLSIGGTRDGRPMDHILRYTTVDLIRDFEAKFEPGMTWENYGRHQGCWETHHVRPVSTFRFFDADDPEFRKCWSLENLVPCWHDDHAAIHAELRGVA